MADGGRKLGVAELMYEHLTGRFSTSIYFQAAVLRSNYLFTVDEFVESLKILINFQPFLRMKVVKESGLADGRDTYSFRPCEVDARSLLRVRRKPHDEDWIAIINEEEEFLTRDERFGDGPQWRVVLSAPEDHVQDDRTGEAFYTYDVVFIMQHMFADAVSSYDMVYRQLLPILNNIVNNRSPDDKFLHPWELPPSYEEEFLKLDNSGDAKSPWYIKFLMSMVRAKNRLFKDRLYEPVFDCEGAPYNEDGTGPCTKVINEDLLDMILEKRKEKGIGVHSILLAALSFATLKLFQKHGIALPKIIKGGWPIDSRKFNPKFKSPQPLALFTCSSGMSEIEVPSPFEASKELFWEKAKSIDVGVRNSSKRQSDMFGPLVLTYLVENLGTVENFGDFFCEFGYKTHFVLSNLAKCSPGPELTETFPNFVDAEEMYFGICGKGFGQIRVPFFVTAVNHKNKIFISNCYSRKWVGRNYVCEFMDYVEEMLDMACEEDNESDDEFEIIGSQEADY